MEKKWVEIVKEAWKDFSNPQKNEFELFLNIAEAPSCQGGQNKKEEWQDWFQRALRFRGKSQAVQYLKKEDRYRFLGIELHRRGMEKNFCELPLYPKGKNKALFLDRDGVINEDFEYVYQKKKIVWKEGIFELIHWGMENQYHIIVLTNQSGVGKGYYDEKDVVELHREMDRDLEKRGLCISRWYYCPFHEQGSVEKFRRQSLLRKPKPGLALWARQEWDLDLSRCLMVGDKKTDRLEGLDIETFFLQGKYDLQGEENIFSSHRKLIHFLIKRNLKGEN